MAGDSRARRAKQPLKKSLSMCTEQYRVDIVGCDELKNDFGRVGAFDHHRLGFGPMFDQGRFDWFTALVAFVREVAVDDCVISGPPCWA